MITTFELTHMLQGDKTVLLEQFHRLELVPKEGHYLCPKCSAPLRLITVSGPEEWQWHCRNSVAQDRQRSSCNTVLQFRTGTIFEKSNLSVLNIILFIYFWVKETELNTKCDWLSITSETAVGWSSFCREVVLQEFLRFPQKLGGPECIVKIYESKFSRRKYHRGQGVEGHWVLGGYERGTGRVFMVIVENRSAETLFPIIREWIEPGTTIISDSYDCLSDAGYIHVKVNRSMNFVDPDTGAHTNSVESANMPSASRPRESIPGVNSFETFLKLAGKFYNPLQPQQAPDDGEITDEE